MRDFPGRIMTLESEIRELNTDGVLSSSSLAVAEHELTVTMEIVGYDGNYHNSDCAGRQAALIELAPKDGKSMLTSASLMTNSGQLTDRSFVLVPIIINDHPAYEFRIVSGSPADLTTIQGGGSIPSMDFKLLLSATSDFNVNLTYRTDH